MKYTSLMQKSSQTVRWWDWPSLFILFLLLETVAWRLVTTNWTSFLFVGQTVTFLGYVIGVSLGYTRFSPRLTRWISFLYMLVLLPLQWTLVMDQDTSLEEQLMSMGGRLYFSLTDFFARRPVEDPFLFIAFITLVFWIVSASAGFRMVRTQNYLWVVIPSAVGLLMLQGYDNFGGGRIWIIGFYAFLALLLLGRLNYLENKKLWREKRIFLSSDNSFDLTSTMAVAALVIILFSWTSPASVTSLDSAVQTWSRVTKPWRMFTDRMKNAFTSLESPSGGIRGEFFGSEIALGRGFPLSDSVMFRVQAPDIPTEDKPPRYYWRGRTYDYYYNGQWYTTGSEVKDYSPSEAVPALFPTKSPTPKRFIFNTGDITFSLVYTPSQTIWLSRRGATRIIPEGNAKEVISWYAFPSLQAGDAYQVDAVLSNPDVEQLRQAGTNYPASIGKLYLQMPGDFSPKIVELAKEITAQYDNPFDKATAITSYLRENIEYSNTLPIAPLNQDPLEWMLFEHKKAYCVYYSSAEIMMLRSLGIPARLAVGFAQGERSGNNYIVRRNDAHAWPEVYFPNIGWVEFEPTGSQPSLGRPFSPTSNETNNGVDSGLTNPLQNNNNLRGFREEGDVTPAEQAGAAQPVNPSLYLLPVFIVFIVLTVYFGRRYAVPARLPVILRTTYERTGFQTPNWVANWERWVNISPIERAFESINFSLGLLKHPVPIHATPIERVHELNKILPKVGEYTQNLLDEHQTYLYTSRKADAARARHAAFNIRKFALLERIRYIFEGKPIQYP